MEISFSFDWLSFDLPVRLFRPSEKPIAAVAAEGDPEILRRALARLNPDDLSADELASLEQAHSGTQA